MRLSKVIFVLGGPGSGKGTQSLLIQHHFHFKHLSAGQLLRQQQRRPNSNHGPTISRIIDTGAIVPSAITIELLKNEIEGSKKDFQRFIIDGFPRNVENYNSWWNMTKGFADVPFVIHLVCTEQQMLKRLQLRAKQEKRTDDTVQIIKKRFKTYRNQTLPVIESFKKHCLVRDINADRSVQQIFSQISPIFNEYLKKNSQQNLQK